MSGRRKGMVCQYNFGAIGIISKQIGYSTLIINIVVNRNGEMFYSFTRYTYIMIISNFNLIENTASIKKNQCYQY